MHKITKKRLAWHIGLITAATAGYQLPASAQGGFALEEVIVTAQKREENLQDVGISVTALDQQGMERAGITDISRLELVTPGMSYGFIGADSKVAMRGANSNNTFADNSSIAGFFLDGVYRPRASQQSQAYFDVARVEVLKGPQGTLYGRNTFAGAINVYTNKPDTEALSGGLRGSVERFGRYTTEGFINVPVSDNAALRVAFNTKDSDGYINNNGPGEDLGQDEARNFRISGLWSNDFAEMVLRYSSVSQKGIADGIFAAEGICQPINERGITDAFGRQQNCENPNPNAIGNTFFDEPWEVSYDVDAARDNSEENLTFDGTFDISDSLSARFITSWTEWDSEFDWDGDYSSAPGYVFFWDEEVESVTAEFQLNYSIERFEGTFGLYYSVDEIAFGFSQYRTSPPQDSFSDFADFQEIETDTTGIFAQGNYSITDQFRVIAGIRYNEEEKDTETFSGFSTDANGNPLPGVNPLSLDGRARDLYRYELRPDRSAVRSFYDTTYKLGLEWDMSDAVMFYATWSTGFLSGGVNADGTPFESQESEAYEAGMKSRWLDNTVQANVAVYYNEYTGLTTQELVDLGNGVFQTRTVNGGEIETFGLEADLTWIPDDRWLINAGLSLMDNEYGAFGVANPFVEANGVPQSFISLEGEAPPWAPDITLSLSVGYDFDLGSAGRITPFLQFYYSDEYNTDDVSTYAQQVQDSYTKTDFRVIYTTENEKLEAEAFIENIEDEAVLARSNVGGFDLVQTSYMYPQNFGVRMRYNF
ncbi:MAG: TonB-dependent receptor [Pseudomonadota bacterium]